jgi:hypothetical protein
MKTVRRNSHIICSRRGFALVITLVMVALLAIITIGLLTSVSLERVTAKSYNDRYQADLAAQNGLEVFKRTLVATQFPSPAPSPLPASVTGTDTFLIVRADSGSAPYYYLAQPSTGSAPTISYYPLFSTTTAPGPTPTIDLTAAAAPKVPLPTPAPTSGGAFEAVQKSSGGTIVKRFPTLYPWQQPTSTAGPSVDWVEMRDPQDPAPAPAHNLPYTRYAYWAEDLDGYLDASQVGGQARSSGTSPQEIAMWTVFNSAPQTDPGTTAATTLINNRSLLFTVPTLQQLAAQPMPSPSPDTGAYLAVRLGVDNTPGEQNLIPFGYGYGTEGKLKTNLNPLSQLRGNIPAKFGTPLGAAMPGFQTRTATTSGGKGHSGTVNYINNIAANLIDYVSPQNAPTDFMPNGNQNPPSARGIGAYPFVTSVYDLNNWVYTVPIGTTYQVVIETTTYVQIWNPHNYPAEGLGGVLTVHYQNSDQVRVFANPQLQTLSSPPDATVIFKDNPSPDTSTPVIVSPLNETGNLNQPFNYQIKAANGYQDAKGLIKPNEYRVVVQPGPSPGCTPDGKNPYNYNATGLPPGLSVHGGGGKAGLIDGTPTKDPDPTMTYPHTYDVPISARSSCGTANAILHITIYQ